MTKFTINSESLAGLQLSNFYCSTMAAWYIILSVELLDMLTCQTPCGNHCIPNLIFDYKTLLSLVNSFDL